MAAQRPLQPARRGAWRRAGELVGRRPFLLGTSTDPWAYDNERPAHEVDLPPFWIDTAPVTNATFAEFVDDGGYDDDRLWQPDGWTWRNIEHAVAVVLEQDGGVQRRR